MNKKFENFGHDTDEPCAVCGKKGGNKSESRFGYSICEEHFEMSPVEVSKINDEKKKKDQMLS